MSQSNVGASGVYGANDQTNYKDSELRQQKAEARFQEGQPNSHNPIDHKDERSIANKLAREEKRQKEAEAEPLEQLQSKKDATLPARSHGNEPSKGAKIDQELREEDEAALKKKGTWGSKQQ